MLGQDIARSGINAALHIEGIQRVELLSPVFNEKEVIAVGYNQAAFCRSITVSIGGIDE
ncbi:MAG: hypothetical protein VSS52_012010 [Thiotrichaceae bacterium]